MINKYPTAAQQYSNAAAAMCSRQDKTRYDRTAHGRTHRTEKTPVLRVRVLTTRLPTGQFFWPQSQPRCPMRFWVRPGRPDTRSSFRTQRTHMAGGHETSGVRTADRHYSEPKHHHDKQQRRGDSQQGGLAAGRTHAWWPRAACAGPPGRERHLCRRRRR